MTKQLSIGFAVGGAASRRTLVLGDVPAEGSCTAGRRASYFLLQR